MLAWIRSWRRQTLDAPPDSTGIHTTPTPIESESAEAVRPLYGPTRANPSVGQTDREREFLAWCAKHGVLLTDIWNYGIRKHDVRTKVNNPYSTLAFIDYKENGTWHRWINPSYRDVPYDRIVRFPPESQNSPTFDDTVHQPAFYKVLKNFSENYLDAQGMCTFSSTLELELKNDHPRFRDIDIIGSLKKMGYIYIGLHGRVMCDAVISCQAISLTEYGRKVLQFHSGDHDVVHSPKSPDSKPPEPFLRPKFRNRGGPDLQLTAAEFIKKYYSKELESGILHMGVIRSEDFTLYQALHNWLRNKENKLDFDLPKKSEWNTRQLATLPADSSLQNRLREIARKRASRARSTRQTDPPR